MAIHALPELFHRLLAEPLSACGDRDLLDRFLARGDERAFDALLVRHGPMVLGVCRRSLRDTHLADDVFQATFLVLARQAGKIRRHDSVASFLYGVARRLSRKAHRGETTRRHHEAIAAERRPEPGGSAWQEMLLRLDAELERLPDQCRAPVLLCYLQERTRDEAATQLGWSVSTLRRRLERGRELLRQRLGQGGTALGASALAPPAALTATLRQAALTAVFAEAKGAVVSASVLALADGGVSLIAAPKLISLTALAAVVVIATAAMLPGDAPPKVAPAVGANPEPPAVHPLPAGAVARLGTLAFRHGRTYHGSGSLRFTPDGKHLVSAAGGWVRRWDATTGEAVKSVGEGGRGALFVPYAFAAADGETGWLLNTVYRGEGSEWECKRYDLVSGKLRQSYRLPFPHGTDSAHGLPDICSPDGRFFAEIGHGGIVLYNAATGSFHRFHKHPAAGRFHALAFHPDGKGVLLGGDGHQFTLVDLKTGLPQREFGTDDAGSRVGHMAVSPDGKWLATAGGRKQAGQPFPWPPDRFVRVWDLGRGAVARTLDVLEEDGVASLLFSPDSRTLIAATQGRKQGAADAVRTWDVATGKAGRAWTGDPTIGSTLAVRPDGKVVATMNEAGVIRLWDMRTGEAASAVAGSPGGLEAVCFRPSGDTLFTVGGDLSLREWDAASGRLLTTGRTPGGSDPKLSPGGKYLCASHRPWEGGAQSLYLRVYETKGEKLLHERQGGWGLVFAPDESRVAFTDRDMRVRVVDLATGKEVHTLPPPAGEKKDLLYPLPIGFGRDGQTLVVRAEGLSVWDLRTGKRRSSWGLAENKVVEKVEIRGRAETDEVRTAAVSADGAKVAFGVLKFRKGTHGYAEVFGRVMVFDRAGKVLGQTDSPEVPNAMAFSPDGTRVAWGGKWLAQVWNPTAGLPPRQFEGHRGMVNALAFRPDGKRLATASEDSTVLIWDVSK